MKPRISTINQVGSKNALFRKLLKAIGTVDPTTVAVVNESKYIQHNPQTHEGREDLAAIFVRLSKTNPRVAYFRVFKDVGFVFAHNECDFSRLRVAFEVFRLEVLQVEDGKVVEHRDNIQPIMGRNFRGQGHLKQQSVSDLPSMQEWKEEICGKCIRGENESIE